MNFTLNQGWYEQAVRGVFAMGENYGRTESKAGKSHGRVRFRSTRPGLMHMGNARGGVLGDRLSSVLDWSGNDVTREFYINDAGNQVDKFAHSVEGRYIQEIRGEDAIEFDASWYQGDDIKALAHDLGRAVRRQPARKDPGGALCRYRGLRSADQHCPHGARPQALQDQLRRMVP